MIAAINHRGPDTQAIYQRGSALLAHARLSILDLEGGGQPMSNEDGSLWITFNGEIFNYLELRQILLKRGHRFSTRSDTEVILHLFEDEGEACVQHLNGQWAFAIWNDRTSQLFLSRDRMGVRPLFYTNPPGAFLFASEIKALFANTRVKRDIDVLALDEIFTFWSALPPRTIFEDIHELPPGHSLWLKDGRIQCNRHWQMDYQPLVPGSVDADECAATVLDLLQDSIRLRLRADVAVGAYLSGGLDSTLIASLIQRQFSNRLSTFSIGFEESEFDESSFQAEAVGFLGTNHRRFNCTAAQIQEVFPSVIRHTETPVLRTAPAPMYLLSRLVRDSGYKVVLTGEGADELFGGYDLFKEAKVRRFWAAFPDSRMRPLLLRRLYPYLPGIGAQPDSYLRSFFQPRSGHPFESHQPRWDLTSRLRVFFSDELRGRLSASRPIERLSALVPDEFASWNWLNQAEYLETSFLLPGYILSSQGDRMSMAHSVETRHPFLDRRIVQLASRLPVQLKLRVLNEKFILKQAAVGLVPDSIRRRAKQPYRAPEANCFFRPKRAAYLDDLLSPGRLRQRGLFDPQAVDLLVRKFESRTAIGIKDNMAMVGIVSTALLQEEFCGR